MLINPEVQNYLSNKVVEITVSNIEKRFKAKDKYILRRYYERFFKKNNPLLYFDQSFSIKKNILESLLEADFLEHDKI